MFTSDEIQHQRSVDTFEWIHGILDIDWKWVDKYVEVTPWIKDLTNEITRRHKT